MKATVKAYKNLNGKFPINLKYFFFKGVRVCRDDFKRLDVKFSKG